MATVQVKAIKPQPTQEQFLGSSADIAIYGGAAGGGKTWSLLYEPLRHVDNPKFNTVIFRQNANQIMAAGGLWDESLAMYFQYPGAVPLKTPTPRWVFPSGANINFNHLERQTDVYKWQGSQICLIGFDELTHFSAFVFFYMLSRNRSMSGIKPYVRATCNPDADSWVAEFISWWIDQESGYPIAERSGKIRYMGRINEEIMWGDSPEEVLKIARERGYEEELEADDIKSVTFIKSTIYDNQELLSKDSGYLANLKALSQVERERLLYGNWKIKAAKGLYFPRTSIEILESVPNDVVRLVRGWDLAATSEDEGGDPAYTASCLIGKRRNGKYVVLNVTNNRMKAAEVRKHVRNTAIMDKARYKKVRIRMNRDPGQAGKEQAESYLKHLAGFSVNIERETGSKVDRAEPFASQWQGGNVDIVKGEWNEMYLGQLEAFPESKYKDMVDCSSTAFLELEALNTSAPPPQGTQLGRQSLWTGR